MSRLLILYLFLQVLWLHVSAQAPLDADRACTHPTTFRIVAPTYDDNQYPLLESRHYENLLGSSGVWNPVDHDNNGGGWITGLGGVCDNEVRSCTNRRPSPQENCLFTQYISLLGANEVIVQASYRFSERNNPVFDILLYETAGIDHMKAEDVRNYDVLQLVSALGGAIVGATAISFVPKESTQGFYMGFRENGTCITLTRVLVYAHICPERVFRLVHHPQTFAPARNSGATVDVLGDCLPNSSQGKGTTTRPTLRCAALGIWVETEECECNPGFVYNEETEKCEACPANTYKETYSNSDQCIPCPDNSESDEAASFCTCKTEFYRSENEEITEKCTAPPSAPEGCAISDTKNTSITVEWDLPGDDGGRDDTCFDILYQKTKLLHEGFMKAASGLKQLEYTLFDLNPITEYTIKIVSENGVSSQSKDTEQLRTVEHIASTTEGVPEKITVFARRRGSTFTWQPPSIVNGELTGFCLRVYRQGREDDATLIPLDPLEFCYSPLAEQMPSGSGSVFVQVQAKTVLGGGKWSVPIELPAAQVPTSRVLCSTLLSPSNGEVSLSGSTATYSCDSQYQLVGDVTRTCQSDGTWSGSEPSCVATDNDVRCMLLAAPANGRVTQSGRGVGSSAIYTCVSGYQLVGASNRVCQPDGKWSGERPVCQAACGALLSPDNGVVTQTGATFGHSAIYSCNPGYTMLGAPNRVCNFDGTWTGVVPTCSQPCDVLPNPTNGLVTITRLGSPGILPGSQAVYTCNGGYEINGNSIRDCQSDGTWSGSEPTCTPAVVSCGSLPDPENGKVSFFGDVAVYTCDIPYELRGEPRRTCVDGVWTGVAPTCEPPPLRFELQGTVYASGSVIQASEIGNSEECLRCITDNADCCGSPNRAGQYFYPDGSQVRTQGAGDPLYRGRGVQHICLHRRGTGSTPLGTYRCNIPDSNGVDQNIFITLN